MSDEVKATEVKQETVVESPKAETPKVVEPQIGMKDILSPKAKSQPVETPVVETQPVAEEKPSDVVADPTKAVTTEPEEKETLVPVKVVQAERKKRQEAQQRLLDLQKQNEELIAQGSMPVDQSAIEASVKDKVIAISDASARLAHPDYQEKFDAFNSAVFDGDQINRPLYDSIINSDHPGEAAYLAGKMILFQKEHGMTLDEQLASVEKKAIERERDKIRKEVEAEFLGKIHIKEKQPTNLLTTRSAGGPSEVKFVQPSFGDVLGAKRRR